MKTIFALALIMVFSTIATTGTETVADVTCKAGKDEYCGMCSVDKCSACYNSFLTAGEKACTEVTTALSNCVGYTSATECKTCNVGFMVSSGACVEITEANCTQMLDATKCKYCDNGAPNTAGKCDAVKACPAGCKTCGAADTECLVCTDAAQAWDFGTKTCVASTKNCLLNNGACTACAHGYYVNSAVDATAMTCLLSTKYSSTSVIQTISMLVISFMMF